MYLVQDVRPMTHEDSAVKGGGIVRRKAEADGFAQRGVNYQRAQEGCFPRHVSEPASGQGLSFSRSQGCWPAAVDERMDHADGFQAFVSEFRPAGRPFATQSCHREEVASVSPDEAEQTVDDLAVVLRCFGESGGRAEFEGKGDFEQLDERVTAAAGLRRPLVARRCGSDAESGCQRIVSAAALLPEPVPMPAIGRRGAPDGTAMPVSR